MTNPTQPAQSLADRLASNFHPDPADTGPVTVPAALAREIHQALANA